MKASLRLKEAMTFECFNGSHKLTIDAPNENGVANNGPSPKELLLNAMMGCTAMDAVSILNKMRQKIKSFEVSIEAQKNDTHPIHFINAILEFNIKGEVLDEKAIKAVKKSLTQYCGVNYMISKTCDISYRIINNNKNIYEDKADFNKQE